MPWWPRELSGRILKTAALQTTVFPWCTKTGRQARLEVPACPRGEQRDNNDIMSLQRRQSPLEACHGAGLRGDSGHRMTGRHLSLLKLNLSAFVICLPLLNVHHLTVWLAFVAKEYRQSRSRMAQLFSIYWLHGHIFASFDSTDCSRVWENMISKSFSRYDWNRPSDLSPSECFCPGFQWEFYYFELLLRSIVEKPFLLMCYCLPLENADCL